MCSYSLGHNFCFLGPVVVGAAGFDLRRRVQMCGARQCASNLPRGQNYRTEKTNDYFITKYISSTVRKACFSFIQFYTVFTE